MGDGAIMSTYRSRGWWYDRSWNPKPHRNDIWNVKIMKITELSGSIEQITHHERFFLWTTVLHSGITSSWPTDQWPQSCNTIMSGPNCWQNWIKTMITKHDVVLAMIGNSKGLVTTPKKVFVRYCQKGQAAARGGCTGISGLGLRISFWNYRLKIWV